MRYDFDGFGYQYIDSGSGSDWQTRHPDAEPLYATPSLAAQDGLVDALRPLVDLQHQKGAWSIIQKAASDFEPVTLTITKRQMLDLLAALASIEVKS